jgi:hypothetical protein
MSLKDFLAGRKKSENGTHLLQVLTGPYQVSVTSVEALSEHRDPGPLDLDSRLALNPDN